jgi:DNA-directed RNA polymerase beta subunit
MKSALMTLGIKNGATQQPGPQRITYCATLSHLRRVSTNIDKNSKLIQPRSSTALSGVFCPAETPEGHMWDLGKICRLERS